MATRWRQIAVRTNVAWPSQIHEVAFENSTIQLRPAGLHAPDVIMQFDDAALTDIEALRKLREFLSVLTWLRKKSIHEYANGVSSVYLPQIGPPPQFQEISKNFQIKYFPDLSHPKAKLGLAIFREAVTVNSTAYKYLGYWKIISMLFPDGQQSQFQFIKEAIGQLNGSEAKARLEQLERLESIDEVIKKQLYGSRRCAVAHATTTTVNPDNPDDQKEIEKDICIVRAIAEHILEKELGVRNESQLWEENGFSLPAEHTETIISQGQLANMIELAKAGESGETERAKFTTPDWFRAIVRKLKGT